MWLVNSNKTLQLWIYQTWCWRTCRWDWDIGRCFDQKHVNSSTPENHGNIWISVKSLWRVIALIRDSQCSTVPTLDVAPIRIATRRWQSCTVLYCTAEKRHSAPDHCEACHITSHHLVQCHAASCEPYSKHRVRVCYTDKMGRLLYSAPWNLVRVPNVTDPRSNGKPSKKNCLFSTHNQ